MASRVSENVVLGMPLSTAHNCSLEFSRLVLLVNGRELTCTDRHERVLMSSVQVTAEPVIPPQTETALLCQATARNFCLLGLVEGYQEHIPIATSLNRP